MLEGRIEGELLISVISIRQAPSDRHICIFILYL